MRSLSVVLSSLIGLSRSQSTKSNAFLIPFTDRTVVNDADELSVATAPEGITGHHFKSKVDHFNATSATFNQRYWISSRHYKPGGPVIALSADQSPAPGYVRSLDYGIVDEVLKQTNGLGVVIEQRYFGKSIPTPDFSTKNLQWLTLEQTLQDYIYFARNVDLGYKEALNSNKRPWIWFGGAHGAFLLKRYPEDILGAVASSATVHAKEDFWEYWDQVRINGGLCTERVVDVVNHLDHLIKIDDKAKLGKIKIQFGLQNLTDHRDFMWVLSHPLLNYGVIQWNRLPSIDKWKLFCDTLDQGLNQAKTTPGNFEQLLSNYARYIIKEYVDTAIASGISDPIVERYSPLRSKSLYQVDHSFGLEQDWRAYIYLKCTEYGLHSAAAPEPHPSLFSRVIDLEYISYFCKTSFTDSPESIPRTPHVEHINQYGGANIAAKNLLLVDGVKDPGLGATPHDPAVGPRINDGKHYWLIPDAYAQADLFGINPKKFDHKSGNHSASTTTPPGIIAAHKVIIATVTGWLAQTKA